MSQSQSVVNQLSALFNAPIDLLKEHTPEYLSNLYGTVDYTYDNAGNRLTMTTDGILTQYSYDAANQLVAAGDRNFTYDGAGNVIAITSMEEQSYYKYDGANRLTGVTYDDETYAAYSYDAFGRMVSREVGEYDPENIKDFNEKAKIKMLLRHLKMAIPPKNPTTEKQTAMETLTAMETIMPAQTTKVTETTTKQIFQRAS